MAGIIIPTTTTIALGDIQIAIGTKSPGIVVGLRVVNLDDDRLGCRVLIQPQGGTYWRLKASIIQVRIELSKGNNHEKVASGYQYHCIIVILLFSLFTWD
jgi:hypothetical protein